MGVAAAGGAGAVALYSAVGTAAVGAATTAYTVNAQRKAAEEAANATKTALPGNAALAGAQSTQSTINAQQSLNAQAGSFISNPAVSSAPNTPKKGVLGG